MASKPHGKRGRMHPEHEQQALFFRWARDVAVVNPTRFPLIQWCHASLNGEYLPWSAASRKAGVNLAAVRAKQAGMTKGVWDVFYPYPCNGLSGLWIEFKIPPNDLTEEQKNFRYALCKYYKFEVAISWYAAVEAVKRYFA